MKTGVVVLVSLLVAGSATAFNLHDLVELGNVVTRWWSQPHPPLDWTKPEYDEGLAAAGTPNLIELATDLKLHTCVKKLREVGLDRVLNHEGWFTLFCPTDEAFSKEENVPVPNFDSMTSKMRLTVARGLYNSSDFHNEAVFRSMLPKRLIRINKYETGKETQIRTANGQPIISLNHRARNGYVHILNGVMNSVYARGGSVMTEIEDCCPQHHDIIHLIKTAGMFEKINSNQPITFLAPTNGAFARLHPDFVKELTKDTNLLKKVINSHIIPGTWYTVGLKTGDKLKTWANNYVTITKDQANDIRFSGAKVGMIKNVNAVNGVAHSLQSLIVPADIKREIDQLLAKMPRQ